MWTITKSADVNILGCVFWCMYMLIFVGYVLRIEFARFAYVQL